MSVHDHHNDPKDPVNQPPKRSRSAMDPVDRPIVRREGMGAGAWMLGLLALLIIGGIIYGMSDRTTTATNTGTPPATTATPGTTGTGSNPATSPRTTTGAGSPTSPAGSPTTPPAAPSPNR